ncbi:MAG: DNA polymerase III subunit epsilon [Hydrogenophilaceae bacterium]|nr:DNA polymerase III subunit epsilon [Hydrogenophilaceae bacterium]
MRKVVLDTETTGLDPAQGHRIIEIGALEIVNRQATGRSFHVYLNPDREIDAGAIAVHGLTNEFLADKPRFPDVVEDLLGFVAGAELVIHNAPFDMGFLNAELRLLDRPALESTCLSVLDTLKMAKDLHPGQKNNLDALCRRYEVDNSNRAYHGALLDAQLLAEVYLAMTRGQESLGIESVGGGASLDRTLKAGVAVRVLAPTPEELALHAEYLAGLAKESGAAVEW